MSTLRDRLTHPGGPRRPSVVEGHPQLSARSLDGVHDEIALVGVNRHRLLGDGVASQLHGPYDVLVVVGVDGGHDHDVGARLLDHPVEVVGAVGGDFVVGQLLHQAAVVVGEPSLGWGRPAPPAPPRLGTGWPAGSMNIRALDPAPTRAYLTLPSTPITAPSCVVSPSMLESHRTRPATPSSVVTPSQSPPARGRGRFCSPCEGERFSHARRRASWWPSL